MREERGHVSDIIRQEFADRIVTTEEESKRIKNEISELRAKHRIELERMKQEVEDIKKVKDEEMEEVHKRFVILSSAKKSISTSVTLIPLAVNLIC